MKWSYTKRNFPVYSGNLCKSWSLFAMFTVVDRLGTNGCYGKMMEATLNFGCTLNLLLFSYGWNPNVEAARLLNALVKFDKHFDTTSSQKRAHNKWTALKVMLFLVSSVPESTCFCVAAHFLMDPCSPPLLGSILLNCPNCETVDRNEVEWYALVGLIVGDTLHTITAMHNGCFYFLYVILVTFYSLLQYVTVLEKR
ncbi:hypothetical protein Fcan01_26541 [Folsomia candida]|uniref:Uncharacterized protein n=1 Tax=Folsomia candida TaxID=158441 RepID=A0A226D0Z5_FOLCA|nr:hypothetical protein Fcan01_26541 [Folsomia candida]